METREDNLKKINDKLEQLSDEELEDVAGGWGSDTLIENHFEKKRKKLSPHNNVAGGSICACSN